jgi:hypothetical protein
LEQDIVILARAILELRYIIEQMMDTGFDFHIEEELQEIIDRE